MVIFSTQRKCLTLVGHSFSQYTQNGNFSKRKHFFLLFITGILNVNMLWFTVSSVSNLNLATAGLSIALTNLLTMAKFMTFIVKLEPFLEQMEQFENILMKIINPTSRSLVMSTNKFAIKIGRWYCFLALMTGFYFMTAPILKILWSIFQKQEITKELPYPMKFPFELYTWRFVLVYLYSGVATWIVVLYAIAVDGIFILFIANLSAHFRVLQSDILNSHEHLGRDLKKHAKYHNFLLEISDRVGVLYMPIILAQFLLSSLQFCVIIFQIVNNLNNFTILLPNITFLVTIFLQLLIYCYGGEVVMQESLQVNSAIQESLWYDLSPKHRRMVCFIIQRSQKPVVLKAGFYSATLESFMVIVQAAMSYITLVQSLD